MPGTILLAVDFSEPSRQALEAAIRLALDMKADIVLAHAYAPRIGAPKKGSADPISQVHNELDQDEAVTLSTEWAGRIRERGIPVRTVARSEKPERLILEEAEAADAAIIVVGTHGRRGFRQLVLGSVTQAVVTKARRPVLVVPSPEPK